MNEPTEHDRHGQERVGRERSGDASTGVRSYDVGIIGGGTAAERLAGALSGSGRTTVVFEPRLVGGECPFYACMPSKSMLHDGRVGRSWMAAVSHRTEVTEGLDDSGHVEELVGPAVDLVRSYARIEGPGRIVADDVVFGVEHIVLATGAAPVMPYIEGAERCAEAIWTSDDALTTDDRPDSIVIVGSGVIGTECATLFSRFGTNVTLVESADRLVAQAPGPVAEVLATVLADLGVVIHYGAQADVIRLVDDTRPAGPVEVELSNGRRLVADKVLVAIGRRPSTDGLGLEALGLDPAAPLPLEPNGRVRADGSVWAVGDVAGRGQYTHLANHQATVVADHLVGTGTRTFDDVVVPACMFTDPPYIQVGPSWSELVDDDDVVAASMDLAAFPRAITDEVALGHLWLAARRSTGCLVAGTGIGPGFDELTHAITIAIDGRVPVARLRQSMQAFPTMGEILGPLFDDLHDQLSSRPEPA